ncbi:N-acetylmuramoyl-L-alanine amidase [Nocardia sp. CA-290969]|uniref:N-acetylmuramoyl-L-alanine amidase n=1 Tax=Nocardia sp. CA-290969 TaxID=3239986 RepID=UPI003D903988
MPYRKPKRSYVLPVVALVAVAGPILVPTVTESGKPADQVELTAVPPLLTQLALKNAPDIVLPLGELTGLDLPDLHLSDLQALGLPGITPSPTSPGPGAGMPGRQPGLGFVTAAPGGTPAADTPALTPGVIPPEFMNAVGAQVKELTREQPFSMVALTAPDLANTTVMVRAKQPDGAWGQWYEASPIDGADGVADGAPAGTDPIYVGNTTAVQVLVTRKPRQSPGGGLEPTPAAAGEQAPPDLTAVLIDPGRGAVDDHLQDIAAALPGGGPRVITRDQWGADESIRCQEPTYDDGLGGITVHHTAGRNDYSKGESAGIVRAIYAYHSQTLGWCDIGYNALVDKYGQIFEGRYGGLNEPVQGAHAGGFNENTSGVAIMGDYQAEQPTDEAVEATGKFVGWRARIAGLDPRGQTTMYSEGTEFTPYAQGEEVRLPVVFAHRDVGNTSCPGDAAYAQMDRIRTIAAGEAGQTQSQAQAPRSQASRSDLAALADLTAKLLTMVNDNLIARYWASKGGPDGPLGQAASEPLPAAQGQQYAKFVNGYVYTAPDGQAHEVVGKILDRFLELGADTGALGLPLTSPYPVPEGLRADFQNGSLILNTATDIVTTLWKTYNELNQQQVQGAPGTPNQHAPGTPAGPGTVAPAPALAAPVPGPQQAPAIAAPVPGHHQAPVAAAPELQQTPADPVAVRGPQPAPTVATPGSQQVPVDAAPGPEVQRAPAQEQAPGSQPASAPHPTETHATNGPAPNDHTGGIAEAQSPPAAPIHEPPPAHPASNGTGPAAPALGAPAEQPRTPATTAAPQAQPAPPAPAGLVPGDEPALPVPAA